MQLEKPLYCFTDLDYLPCIVAAINTNKNIATLYPLLCCRPHNYRIIINTKYLEYLINKNFVKINDYSKTLLKDIINTRNFNKNIIEKEIVLTFSKPFKALIAISQRYSKLSKYSDYEKVYNLSIYPPKPPAKKPRKLVIRLERRIDFTAVGYKERGYNISFLELRKNKNIKLLFTSYSNCRKVYVEHNYYLVNVDEISNITVTYLDNGCGGHKKPFSYCYDKEIKLSEIVSI